MKLSVVTTLPAQPRAARNFTAGFVRAAEQVAAEIELVMVTDGSPDNSLELSLKLQERDPRVVVVDLSRNFSRRQTASGDGWAFFTNRLNPDPPGTEVQSYRRGLRLAEKNQRV